MLRSSAPPDNGLRVNSEKERIPMVDSQASQLVPAVVEKHVEEIWRSVLDMPEGRKDLTFFDLQGQSISAVRIVARVEDELGVAVDVGVLFEDPDLTTFTRTVLAAMDTTRAEPDAA